MFAAWKFQSLRINIDIAKTEYDNRMQDINFKYRNLPWKTIIIIIIIVIIIFHYSTNHK